MTAVTAGPAGRPGTAALILGSTAGVTRYIDYLMPGILVLAIGFGATQTGVAIAEDLTTGMIDRFRSLPVAGAAVLAGRVIADALRNLFVAGLMIAVGAAIGFRFHAGPAGLLAVTVPAAVARYRHATST